MSTVSTATTADPINSIHTITSASTSIPIKSDNELLGLNTQLQSLINQFQSRSNTIIDQILPTKVLALDSLYQKYSKLTESTIEWTSVGCNNNTNISLLIVDIKAEIHILLEILDPLRMWIQLNIPKLTDQTGTSTNVKQELVDMLNSGKLSGLGVLDSISKYYSQRGKLVSKVLKFPLVMDYTLLISELDQKQYRLLLSMLLDLRNNYSIVYDYIVKNKSKLIQIQEQEQFNHMY